MVEERIQELEKRIAVLEEKIQAQQKHSKEISIAENLNIKDLTKAKDDSNIIYVLQFNLNNTKYFLADLQCTLSQNIKDCLIIINNDVASRIGGYVENIFESKFNTVVSCEILRMPLSILIKSIGV